MHNANRRIGQQPITSQIIRAFHHLIERGMESKIIWFIQYDKLADKENVLITPFGVRWVDNHTDVVLSRETAVEMKAFGPELLLKPNDILESFNRAPRSYGICDYSDKGDYPRVFEVTYGPESNTTLILEGDDEQHRIFSMTVYKVNDHYEHEELYSYTYDIDVFLDADTPLIQEQETEKPFFQKYGHADIVLKNQRGSSGYGTLEMDGFSIGWKKTCYFRDGKSIEYTFRGNYSCSNSGASPTFITIIRSTFDFANITLYFHSTDPEFEGIPKQTKSIKANRREEFIFSANKVMNKSEGNAEVEVDPEVHDDPVNHKYDHLLNVPKTLYNTSPAVLKSGNSVYEMAIQTNGAIKLISRHHSSSHKLARSIHRHLWIGLALDGSDKKIGKNYWYLLGGEEENPSYRVIKKYLGQYQQDGDEYYEAMIMGYIKDLDLDYKVVITLAPDHSKFKDVKVELQSPKGFNGYLDIISDIKFGFYDDGPIKIDLPPNKLFTFIGH